MTKNGSKSIHFEADENEFEKTHSTSIQVPQNRFPLTAIPDPTQFDKVTHEPDHESKEKSEGSGNGRVVIRSVVDRKFDSGNIITPARNLVRSVVGVGACSGHRGTLYSGGRGGSSSRVTKVISTPGCESSPIEVQHFELVEDPSFWNDHNVQVLIRMRPISHTERISQGYGRCLRQESSQTLLWLGHPEMRFTFDHIASESISQERLFKVAGMPMVDNCMSGYNSCMFAYGQTGSGKTYTMMGEISQMDGMLSEDCGITPRLFEYLFARIKEQEENRRDERLKYSCKCSFLEIYNEQITDLLEPSSINLQLREDVKKGVYVENLTEYNVRTVDDVLKLLLQGAANRKVAGTNMNSESSRSHSVFTCIIESHWEKDSMTHLRFGRLNLVDLAGSERQKSSGAEGDRLKEAANINKSLSTLGLVIMSLVDLAHGKHRHVPYRDSRLTFLLQDSLGGNSKTTIIANVSPSICSASETLSTLKFAQRAKLIQNNAKINEDASGDVTALQRQVQVLKRQLSLLLKHHNISRSLSHHVSSSQHSFGGSPVRDNPLVGRHMDNEIGNPNGGKSKLYVQTESLKATLAGALRREKSAETATRTLEAQIEQMNRLASQREEEVQRTKMMLKFREEKIKRLELIADDLTSVDSYLVDENNALKEEIQLLRARADRNPEVTRFALENIRLLEQLRLFEDFYEEGEREKLLSEVSSLRDQLLEILVSKESDLVDNFPPHKEYEDGSTTKELEECKSMNSRLIREVDELRSTLRAESVEGYIVDGVQQKSVDHDQRLGIAEKDLMETKILLEAMESEQVCLIEELDSLRQENDRLMKIISNTSEVERELVHTLDNHFTFGGNSQSQNLRLEIGDSKHSTITDLEVKLDQMTKDLEDARVLRSQHQINEHQIDLVREEVEMETANTIIHLQEEVAALQEDLRDRLCSMAEENKQLRDMIIAKEDEMGVVHSEWERASLELTSFLLDGSKSLRDASRQIESIACSFPRHNVLVGEHVKNAAKLCLEKEETILLLQRSLEDAQKMVQQMEQKLNSLKGATMALTAVQHIESVASTKETIDGFPTHEQQKIMQHQVIDELAKTNNRLNVIRASIHIIMNKNGSSDKIEDSEGWLTDCSTQSSNFSDDPVVSCDIPVESSSRSCNESPFEATGHSSALEFEESSLSSFGNQESAKFERVMYSPSETEIALLCLKKEFKIAYDGFIKLNVQLASLFEEKDLRDCSQDESVEFVKSNGQDTSRDGLKQPKRQEMVLQPSEVFMQEAEALCFDADKLVADKKVCQATSFLTKFEEASTTMNEADMMLNALLKANENAKTLTGLWKQTGKELMVEKAGLIDEIAQLKSYIRLREEENEFLQDHSECSLQEIAHSMSLLESSFFHMQRHAEDMCTAAYSEALTMARNFLQCVLNSRLSLKDICAENMEKEFASFVVQQCHMGEFVYQDSGLRASRLQEEIKNHLETRCIEQNNSMANGIKGEEVANESGVWEKLERSELDGSINESLKLKKELERKDMILDGLLFDFSLLQESASTRQDIKEETENLNLELSKVRDELNRKTSQLDDMLVQHKRLEGRLFDTESALRASSSDLERAKEALDVSSHENADLRIILEDIYLKKSEVEEQLEEQREVVRTLENQILSTSASAKKQLLSSLESIEDDLRRVSEERDQLREQVISLQDTLDMAYALADENDAIAIEARQESEASKVYAEQKEEEVKILEHSVEELDSTINILERKVNEMEEEVERHLKIRDSLEMELQALNQRLLTFDNYKESMESEISYCDQHSQDQLSRKLHRTSLELHEAHQRIRLLEDERAEQAKEIKQCKDYISELVLHAEAQASQYQQKYKTLETMIREVKTESLAHGSEAPTLDRTEKSLVRTRGSSSPFRCITNLVQQMNTEKDQELSLARLHIEELDDLAASRQKEICMLNARLAAAESMTHDVIRDLLGVKMDMTNYANLIDQYQLQRLIDAAQQQTEESVAMEQEILHLRRQINDLLEERERFISEVNRREADIFATQMAVEQLQERDQLLTAQNEMLKKDKTNLQRKAAELDDMVKKLLGSQSVQPRYEQQPNSLLRPRNTDFSKRLAHSEKLLFRVNDELARYRDSSDANSREIRFRK